MADMAPAQEAMTRLAEYAAPPPPDAPKPAAAGETIEERCFSAALICLEGHFTQSPPMGPQTAAHVSSIITKTLEKTHTLRAARFARPLAPTRTPCRN